MLISRRSVAIIDLVQRSTVSRYPSTSFEKYRLTHEFYYFKFNGININLIEFNFFFKCVNGDR
jgi:hypothetical protein